MKPDSSITFRRLEESDLAMLAEWLFRPHVREWWRPPDEPARAVDQLRENYIQNVDGTRAFIACLGGEPIGFAQAYVAMGSGGGWWEEETDPGVLGIDQFLAHGDRLGQGLGTRMVQAFARQLLAEPGVTRIQTDPDPANRRAVRCYEKAGFHAIREVVTPDGPALLMTMEKTMDESRPTLTDGRILLRPLGPADCDALHAAVDESRETVGRWMSWCKPDYARKDAEEWLAHSETNWASETGERTFGIFEAASREFLGNCGLNQFNRVHHFANLGYWIRASRVGKGTAPAAARLLARYGFETLGLARIEIVAQVANAASRRVAEKAGARLEGIARNRLAFGDRHFDAAMYSLVPGDTGLRAG